MRQSAEKLAVESLERVPTLTIVRGEESGKGDEAHLRPELVVLGWEPRARRLASVRSGGKSKS